MKKKPASVGEKSMMRVISTRGIRDLSLSEFRSMDACAEDRAEARRIDAAVRKAAWEGYERGERAQKHWDKDRDREWASEQVSMENKYGPRPARRAK